MIMKKLGFFAVLCTVLLISCNVEPLGDETIKGINSQASSDCEVNLLPDLPDMVYACADAKPGTDSYFDLSIADGPLAGSYAAWCVDVARSLDEGDCFEANVFSSYDVLPDGAVDRPENFDLINWVLNQDFVGKLSENGTDTYTLGDVQWAMWELIDDTNCVSCSYLPPYDVDRGNEIVQQALASGQDYEPTADGVIAVVLVPTNGKQVVIIPYTAECKPEPVCETAFAFSGDQNDCFINNGFSRWGWSIKINEPGDYTYDIYAGAGQCDLSKGELVGTVDVSYSNAGNVSVTYNIDSSYTVNETHTYAGKNMFPSKKGKKGGPTVAPGQYTISDNLDGEIYVIAHAVVCK